MSAVCQATPLLPVNFITWLDHSMPLYKPQHPSLPYEPQHSSPPPLRAPALLPPSPKSPSRA